MATLAALLAAWSFVIEPRRLVVRHEALTLPHWPAAQSGLRVALLSDIHGGAPHVSAARLRDVVATTNAQQPDLIVLLGDYVIQGVVGGRFMPPEEIAPILGGLRAPLGVHAVLGNHDGWLDTARVTAALAAAGLPVLDNDARPVERHGQQLWIAGLADAWTGGSDIPAALSRVPTGAPVLLLTHNPDVFPKVPARVSLTLAGHTHGGQVALPFLGRPIVPSEHGQRYAIGHVVEDGRHLFVTSGIGTSIFPVRLGVPPEIVVLTLAAATASPPR